MFDLNLLRTVNIDGICKKVKPVRLRNPEPEIPELLIIPRIPAIGCLENTAGK